MACKHLIRGACVVVSFPLALAHTAAGAFVVQEQASRPLQAVITTDTRSSRHVVRFPGAGPHLVIDPVFVYAGGQRFTLRNVADIEQHVFLTSRDGRVQRALWVQFERLLPGRPGGYSYDSDRPLTLGGFRFREGWRRFTEPPAPDSDRRRAWDLFGRAGYGIPDVTDRIRLTYVPDADTRQELMVVYLEPSGSTGPQTVDDGAALLGRMLSVITIEPAP